MARSSPVKTHGLTETHRALWIADGQRDNDPDGYEVEIWYEVPTPVDPA